jgi:hypothetical protein
LTSSPTQSPGAAQLQIYVQDAYEIGLGCFTYAWKEDEINFPMELVLGRNKMGLHHNYRNNFNIQSPTHLGAIHIKTDAQVTYNVQLGHS